MLVGATAAKVPLPLGIGRRNGRDDGVQSEQTIAGDLINKFGVVKPKRVR